MMPLAMEPAMPSALASWRASSLSAAPTPAAAAMRAEHGGGMEARLVHRLGRDQAQAADGLDADRDAEQRRWPSRLLLLGGGEHGRHDDGAGVHRAALEGVVEVLAVGGGAVDEGGAGGAEALRGGRWRWPGRVRPGGERGLHVVGAAGDDARPTTSISSRSQVSRTAAGSRAASRAAMRWASVGRRLVRFSRRLVRRLT